VSSEEINCATIGASFVCGNDTSITSDEDYIYIYKEDLSGYEVMAIDKTKTEYGAIKTGINGIDTIKLADNMFVDETHGTINQNFAIVPKIPDTVTAIGSYAFYNCIGLKSVSIPNGVIIIGERAFSGNNAGDDCQLANVVFGKKSKLTTIGHEAFTGTELTSIIFPNSLTSIGEEAFWACSNLSSIAFDGTIEQWNSISKGSNWNLNVPATHVHCSDGDVAL
jgi:hypothetical protein